MINWKVRLKNPNFWLSIVPAAMLVVQSIAAMLGMELELADMQGKLLGVLNAVFALLALLGVVNDPTTAGLADSTRAMCYDSPHR